MRRRTRSLKLIILLTASAIPCAVWSQEHQVRTDLLAPIEKSQYARVSSHQEFLDYLAILQTRSPEISAEIIGTTTQGRSIPLLKMSASKFGSNSSKLRVFIFSSQHGNEPSDKEALLLLLKSIALGERSDWLKNLDLLIVPSVNADGNEAGRRQNGQNADLNRSHLILDQPESQAIHRVFNRWLPEMTLDVHEFGAFNREWVARGFVRAIDEQFGAPTNLNVSPALLQRASDEFFPYLERSLAERGVRFFDYMIVDSPDDTVRHSTTSINDGRQSLAILNTFAFILEGRNGRGFHDDLERRTKGQLAAIEAFVQYASDHASEIKTLVQTERSKLIQSKDPVVLRMDYVYEGKQMTIPVRVLSSGKDSTVALRYAPRPKPISTIERPAAYLIPSTQTELINFLNRHQVKYRRLEKVEQLFVESYEIDTVEAGSLEGKNTYLASVMMKKGYRNFAKGDVYIPLEQLRSTMLVIALEPESMWGLIQYDEYAFLRSAGTTYPIYRVSRQHDLQIRQQFYVSRPKEYSSSTTC